MDGVSNCDIYLGIYPKNRYGWDRSPIGISPTHEEFREAEKKKKIRLIFVESLKEEEEEDSTQKEFLNEVGDYVDGRFRNEFDDLADLEYKVHRSLVNLLNNDFKIFLSNYKQKILDNFKLVGEAEVDYSVPLEDILQQKLIERMRKEEYAKNEGSKDSISPSNNNLTLCSAITKYERIIILGDPGSGKSTSLKWLTRKLAKDISSESIKKNLIPVYVELRWYKNNLFESILTSLRENGVECNKENIESWLKKVNFIFLLDGLDEVKHFSTFIIDLKNVMAFSETNKFVLTSRNIRDISKLKDFNFREFVIDKLSNPEIKSFIEKYTDEKSAESLLYELRLSNLLIEARNPLILWFMIIIYNGGEEGEFRILSINKGILFKNILENRFLGGWESKKAPDGRNTSTCLDPKIKLLSEIAFAMIDEVNDIKIDEEKVSLIIDNYLKDGRSNYKDLRETLFEQLVESHIIVREGDQLSFWHKSFRDYFAALKLVKEHSISGKNIEKYVSPKWDESLLFFAGLIDNPSDFVNFLIKPTINIYLTSSLIFRFSLAAKIIGANKKIDEKIQDKIIEQLKSIVFQKLNTSSNREVKVSDFFNSLLFPMNFREAIQKLSFIKSTKITYFLLNLIETHPCDVKVSRRVRKSGSSYTITDGCGICQITIEALKNMPFEEASKFSLLSISLYHKDSTVRDHAQEILKNNLDELITSKLIKKLLDEKEVVKVKEEIIRLLYPSEGFKLCPQPLLSLLLSGNENIISTAARHLNYYNGMDWDKQIGNMLIHELLNSPNPQVRANVARSFFYISKLDNRKMAVSLIKALEDKDSNVISTVSFSLYLYSFRLNTAERKDASKKLIDLSLSCEMDTYVRISALHSYGGICVDADKKELLKLEYLLNEKDLSIRAYAAVALGRLKSKQSIDRLVDLVYSEKLAFPWSCAIEAVCEIDSSFLEVVEKNGWEKPYLETVLRTDPKFEDCKFALEILSRIGTQISFKYLSKLNYDFEQCMRVNIDLYSAITHIERRIKEKKVSEFNTEEEHYLQIALDTNSKIEERISALETLREIGSKTSLEHLKEMDNFRERVFEFQSSLLVAIKDIQERIQINEDL